MAGCLASCGLPACPRRGPRLVGSLCRDAGELATCGEPHGTESALHEGMTDDSWYSAAVRARSAQKWSRTGDAMLLAIASSAAAMDEGQFHWWVALSIL